MRTRLTDVLGIEHPVMLAGMGGVSYSALVAAVSEAGGFGCFGASTMCADEMVDEIRAAKALTDKPLGVDLLTAMPDRLMTDVEALIREGASVFAAGLGVPRDVITLCHEHNVLVLSMCGKVRHAIAAVEAGCDIVVAQGTEAGGHTGQVATLPLVPQVVDAVGDRVPVVAAGGHLRRPRARRRARARGRRRVGRHPLHRHARGPRGRPATRTRCSHRRGRHRHHPGVHRQDPAAWWPTTPPGTSRTHPDELVPFPDSSMKSMAGRVDAPRRPEGTEASTRTASATRPARASARSTRWCPPATSCAPSWPRPSGRSPGSPPSPADRLHRLSGSSGFG